MRKSTINYEKLNSLIDIALNDGNYEGLWNYVRPIVRSQIQNFQKKNPWSNSVHVFDELFQESYFVLRTVVSSYDKEDRSFNAYFRKSLYRRYQKILFKTKREVALPEIKAKKRKEIVGYFQMSKILSTIENEELKKSCLVKIYQEVSMEILKFIDPKDRTDEERKRIIFGIVIKGIFEDVSLKLIANYFSMNQSTIKLYFLYISSIIKELVWKHESFRNQISDKLKGSKPVYVKELQKFLVKYDTEKDVSLREIMYVYLKSRGFSEEDIDRLGAKCTRSRLDKIRSWIFDKYRQMTDVHGENDDV